VLVKGTEVGALRAVDLDEQVKLHQALRRGPVDCGVDLVRDPERVWARSFSAQRRLAPARR